MMVINLAHLGEQRSEGSAAALVQASRHNAARCSGGNVMTVRQTADGGVHMEKY